MEELIEQQFAELRALYSEGEELRARIRAHDEALQTKAAEWEERLTEEALRSFPWKPGDRFKITGFDTMWQVTDVATMRTSARICEGAYRPSAIQSIRPVVYARKFTRHGNLDRRYDAYKFTITDLEKAERQ